MVTKLKWNAHHPPYSLTSYEIHELIPLCAAGDKSEHLGAKDSNLCVKAFTR